MGGSGEAGAGADVALIASAAVGSGKGFEEMVLGAGAGEEWSRVPHVSVGGRCRESDRKSACSGVGKDAIVGLGGSSDPAGGGGICSGGGVET